MSILNVAVSDGLVAIVTDSRATGGGQSHLTSKCIVIPHAQLAIASSGAAGVGTQLWTYALAGTLGGDLVVFIKRAPPLLRSIADTIDAEQRIYELKAGAINAAGDLLSLLAMKSKTAAIAMIAINKGLAIARIVQDTAAAAAKAIAIYGPTPQGFAAAATAKAFGAAQIALVAATGALEIGAVRGSGGGGGGGPQGGASVSLGGSALAPASVATGATPNSSTTIYINGFISRAVIDDLVTQLRREADRDVILFGDNSRQTLDIRG